MDGLSARRAAYRRLRGRGRTSRLAGLSRRYVSRGPGAVAPDDGCGRADVHGGRVNGSRRSGGQESGSSSCLDASCCLFPVRIQSTSVRGGVVGGRGARPRVVQPDVVRLAATWVRSRRLSGTRAGPRRRCFVLAGDRREEGRGSREGDGARKPCDAAADTWKAGERKRGS